MQRIDPGFEQWRHFDCGVHQIFFCVSINSHSFEFFDGVGQISGRDMVAAVRATLLAVFWDQGATAA